MPEARVLVVHANPLGGAVPPYGAERVAQALVLGGCAVHLSIPFLAARPVRAFVADLDWDPCLVALSLRNADDALVVRSPSGRGSIDTRSCLPAVRPLVVAARAREVPVLAGGTGIAALGPAGLAALGVDLGVSGPADDLLVRMGRALAAGVPFPESLPADPRVIAARGHPPGRGASTLPDDAGCQAPGPTPRLGEGLALARFWGTRLPVSTSAGCDRRCWFCVEGAALAGRVRPRPPEEVAAEVARLVRGGFPRIWLAASELNVPDAVHAVAVLRAIARTGVRVDVRTFLQAGAVDDDLLSALEDLGVDPEDLGFEFGHLDPDLLARGAGPAPRAAVDRVVETWLRRGYRMLGGTVLFGGHPAETRATVDRALEAARAIDAALPDGFGLAFSAGARVYPAAPLGRWVASQPEEARPHLYGRGPEDLARPVVYCRPMPPRALLEVVLEGLRPLRGPVTPLNATAPARPAARRALALVDRSVLAARSGRTGAALRALSAALRHDPEQRDALRHRALLLANVRGDRLGARAALLRLRRLVDGEAAAEVDAALAVLGPP
ncbi:MAG: radical SAM protein [Deltaproteobacteria bacterium]|nr:radical SAM protein [Deltaproteobacteria bacterium]